MSIENVTANHILKNIIFLPFFGGIIPVKGVRFMAEHLNSEEIALELTKIYSNNYSSVVNANHGNTRPLAKEHLGTAYQYFLQVVEHNLRYDFSKDQKENQE